MMLEDGATHLAVATDHVVESFRNDLYDGYKTSEGMDPVLLAQFPVLEDALTALGVTVWAMEEQEADDGLAAGARVAGDGPAGRAGVHLHAGQGPRSVRRRHASCSSTGARARSATPTACARSSASAPASIPDYLALGGRHRRRLPRDPGLGREVDRDRARALRAPRGDPGARQGLGRRRARRGEARDRAARGPRRRRPVQGARHAARPTIPSATVDDWRWTGPAPDFAAWTERLGAPGMLRRAERLAERRA